MRVAAYFLDEPDLTARQRRLTAIFFLILPAGAILEHLSIVFGDYSRRFRHSMSPHLCVGVCMWEVTGQM
ncbi:unnamed protein product [Protopolystoma xenopodis]|uniref:Uncharacterized protein n=1 Tax=Protopolystoma xenopodis TaxID=117903 RepID=A0A3S5FFB4_9PLAT|nr:unnamed protein product [Protopolystoma xenopodis]